MQLHNSPGDCVGELFKLPEDAASLLVSISKIAKFWFSDYVWVTSNVG